jgi:predicted DNA-binding antitoxin AbrB/MazE fold protein
MVIRATYKDGVFKPLNNVRLKEGTVVEIDVPVRSGTTVSIRDLPFVGLWKRRRAIPDGLTYVNRLRNQSRY